MRFQNHYFPQSVEVRSGAATDKGKGPILTAKLETLEGLSPIDEATFTPPPDAMAPPRVITLDEKTTRPQFIAHAAAVCPPIAKVARASRDVVIALKVRTDGHVSHLRVLSGPPMLQQAALDAVQKYTYKPVEQDGEPVEVITTVTVQFEIG